MNLSRKGGLEFCCLLASLFHKSPPPKTCQARSLSLSLSVASTPLKITEPFLSLPSSMASSSASFVKPAFFSSSSSQSNPKSSALSFLHTTSASSIPITSIKLSRHSRRFSLLVDNVLKTLEPSQPSALTPNVDLESSSLGPKPRILVSEKLGDSGLQVLRELGHLECAYNLSQEELCSKIASFDALIVRSGTKVTRQVFEAAKGKLKVVGRARVGIDNVDLQDAM